MLISDVLPAGGLLDCDRLFRAGTLAREPVWRRRVVFNSLTFTIFLAVVVAVYWLPIRWSARKLHLLLASYAFYAAWNPPFVVLLWISTAVDWWAAARLHRASGSRRRLYLVLSLAVNLGLLGYFKYGAFVLENFRVLLAELGVAYRPPEMDIILPVGISFYTFQTLSYTIDVYRGRERPAHSFLDFALYVSFFPQLVAGPIVRSGEFLPQCGAPRRLASADLGLGAAMIVAGLFQKVVLADGVLAPVADVVYAQPGSAGFADAWIGTLAFAGQILMDFSGYSTCAIGTALCLGFRIPANFRLPYAAIGFSDFWRRWHISLSSWLRDYLYIPLGGNRLGSSRTLANLMLTMLVGGLWHGAAWHFVVWGAIHGALLILERFARPRLEAQRWTGLPGVRVLAMAFTFAIVCLAWVPFRAGSIGASLELLGAMFGGATSHLELGSLSAFLVLSTMGLLVAAQWVFRDASIERAWRRLPIGLRGACLALLLLAIALAPVEDRAFIYFQF